MMSTPTPRHRAATVRRLPRAAVAAVAAAVAAVLLLGGQGSLAFWTSSAPLSSTSLSSGSLILTAQTPTGGTQGCTSWTLTQTGGTATGSPGSTAVPTYLQPHDVLSQTCTYRLTATGTHVKGTIKVSTGTGYQAPPAGVTFSTASISLGSTVGSAGSVAFNAASNNSVLTIVFRLSVDDATTSQTAPVPAYGGTFSTDGLSLVATQGHA